LLVLPLLNKDKGQGMKALNRLMLGVLLSTSSYGSVADTTLKLTVAPNAQGCFFDREHVIMKQVTLGMLAGEFQVSCSPQSPESVQITPTISPHATFHLSGGVKGKFVVVRTTGDGICTGVSDMPFNSHQPLFIKAGETEKVQVCALLTGSDNKRIGFGKWPLSGAFDVVATLKGQPAWASAGDHVFTVLFDHDSSKMTEKAKQLLAEQLVNIPYMKDSYVELHAHASLVGDQTYNQKLSERRMKTVRDFVLVYAGVDPANVWGVGWGDRKPTALYSISDEATQNRRVRVVIKKYK
jgi:hypothetical protein